LDRHKLKNVQRRKRHNRIRSKVFGTSGKPRLCVFRSNKNIYCQLIDDESQKTITHASTMEKEMREKFSSSINKDAAKEIGKRIAEKAKELGISSICFDRSGYKYHGRIKELGEGAREGGLKF